MSSAAKRKYLRQWRAENPGYHANYMRKVRAAKAPHVRANGCAYCGQPRKADATHCPLCREIHAKRQAATGASL